MSKDEKPLKEALAKKSFRSQHLPFVTNRQVHHWKEIGILDDHREYAASGMKSNYHFFDVLWLRIITEMRAFRISHTSIKEVKKHLFDIEEKANLLYQTIEKVITKNKTSIIIVLKNGSVKVLDEEVYFHNVAIKALDHYLALRLDVLIWEILFQLDFDPDIKSIIQQHKNTNNE
ncbi:hypothetical protein [Aquimarina latercula]|uniref:hypothetical protein n=1 Tax=Aquimarina latercula TaxID=987 RepID=UPI0003F53473|nr:hypothetical protein [Aquimarina latercula]